jgi:TolC family type I secretion outer membrane protein
MAILPGLASAIVPSQYRTMRTSFLGTSLSALAGLAIAVGAAPAPARAETLADAIALAYQTNPLLQAQRAQLRAVNESYVQARAGAGVQVSAQVEAAGQRLDVRDATRRELEGSAVSSSVSVSQPLFAGGRLASAIEAAEAEVLSARERLRQAEADLLQRVIAAYAAVRRDQQILEASRSGLAVLQAQLDETQAKVEVRENTRTDLAQAQARAAANRSQLATFEAQLAISRAQYFNAVGQNPGQLEPEPDLPGLPATVEAAFDAAEASNPTLIAAKREEQATRARVGQARAAFLPSVNLRFQASRSPNALYSPNPYTESLVAQAVVSQPLFTSGLNASGVRRALELNNADRLTIESTRRNVIQTVAQQWAQLVAARTSISSDLATVTAAETAFFGMRQEERFGLRSTIELLNAQQELIGAQISLLRNRYNEYTARAGVLNAIGQLSAGALIPGIDVYDPEADFDRVKNRYALPTEYVVRALDGIVAPDIGPPLAARETTTPDRQAALPPQPSDAMMRAPLRPAAEVMAETQPGPGDN